MRRLLRVLVLSLASLAAQAEPIAPVSLTELAQRSDLVAVAQVRDTDYRTRREIPVSGSAYLRPLITYKGDDAVDIFEIYEKGLHERACYFPNPTVFEEGRRYLVFLVRDPDDPERYRAHPEGCALDVLVDRDNRYALRYPADGIRLSDDLERLAIPMDFADRYAIVADEDLLPQRRDLLLARTAIGAYGEDRWIFLLGIPLHEARRLIDPAALADRVNSK